MAVLKSLVLPPTGLFILILLGILLLRRWPAFAKTCISIGTVLLFALSLPAVATSLLMLHQDYPPILPETLSADGETADGPQAIVVLGADFAVNRSEYGVPQPTGMTFMRLNYAAYLQRKTGLPLLVSAGNDLGQERRGGAVMKRTLEDVHGAQVAFVEQASATTWENAAFSSEILRREGIERVYLVTHAWHMPRAKGAFERHGLIVFPAPTAFATAPNFSIFDWLPSTLALRNSQLSFHEALGRIAYRFR